MPRRLYASLVLCKHARTATVVAVTDTQDSTGFNKRVGENLQRIRKAAGWSQADLADRLSSRGLSFQQPTILKVEKGSRPLKLEEACAIAEELEVTVASLSQLIDDEQAGEALAQIQRSNLIIARTERGIQEMREKAQQNERDTRAWLEKAAAVLREAEQRFKDAGGIQDAEGRWWWHGQQVSVDGEH
jgi:transcriptional regulator with XRE-family HTH domain